MRPRRSEATIPRQVRISCSGRPMRWSMLRMLRTIDARFSSGQGKSARSSSVSRCWSRPRSSARVAGRVSEKSMPSARAVESVTRPRKAQPGGFQPLVAQEQHRLRQAQRGELGLTGAVKTASASAMMSFSRPLSSGLNSTPSSARRVRARLLLSWARGGFRRQHRPHDLARARRGREHVSRARRSLCSTNDRALAFCSTT